MTVTLRELFRKINITDSCFSDTRSKDIAGELYRRHNLQAVLESLSDLKIKRDRKPQTTNSLESIVYLEKVHSLIEHSPDQWISTFACGFDNSDTFSLCTSSLRTVVRTASEQFDKDQEVYVIGENDLGDVKQRAECCLKVLHSLYSKLTLSHGTTQHQKCIGQVILYSMQIITQHMQTNLWTSENCYTLSENFLQDILSRYGCSAVKDVLVMDLGGKADNQTSFRNSAFGKMLVEWKPFLTRDTWRQNPMTVAAFSCSLHAVTFPHLSDFIEYVLPPSLLFLDDHMTRNKLIGIECLVHIIENSSAEELRWYGRADVMFEALRHQLYSTEESILQQTLPALLKILKVLVKPSLNISVSSKYDEILQMILQAAMHENKLVLRRTQTEHLCSLFELMGIGVVKHLNSILNLIVEYLDISDAPSEEARINILKALHTLILTAWPRMRCHSYVLSKSLIKMIHNVSSDHVITPEETTNKLVADAVECLKLLKALDPSKVTALVRAAKETSLSDHCLSALKELTS